MIISNKRVCVLILILVFSVFFMSTVNTSCVWAAEGAESEIPKGTLILRENTTNYDSTQKNTSFAIGIQGTNNKYSATAYVDENKNWSTKLPYGTYNLSAVVPMEYECKSVKVESLDEKGNVIGTVTEAKSATEISITDSVKSVRVTFENNYTKHGFFRASDTKANTINKGDILNRYQADVSAEVLPGYPPTYPMDMVMVLDLSSSMKNNVMSNGKTRLDNMKMLLTDFMKKLKSNVSKNSRIAIVTFGSDVTVKLNLTEIGSLSEQELLDYVDSITIPDELTRTRTDLALMNVYGLLSKQGANTDGRKQHVLMFTDGEPSNKVPMSLLQSFEIPGQRSIHTDPYDVNCFRLMAESVNVSRAIRGNGIVKTNYAMYGKIWENRWFYFHGVPLKKGGTWTNIDDWDQTLRASSKYIDENAPSQDIVEVLKKGECFQSVEGGNFERSAPGLGAVFHAIGVFDKEENGDNYQFIETFMEEVSDKYYMPATSDDLIKAFESVFEDVVIPQKWKAEMIVDEGFDVIDADGATVQKQSDGSVKLVWSGKLIDRQWSDELHPVFRAKTAKNTAEPKIAVTYYKVNHDGTAQKFDTDTEVTWKYSVKKIR